MTLSVRLGFVPSYRTHFSPWCEQMRRESLETLSSLTGVTVVAPCELPAGSPLGSLPGATAFGAVGSLDEAELVAEYFAAQHVDGLVLCPLDFGDERSAAKIAEKLRLPVMLYATKEPPAVDDASLARVSDSYCGNLSMASALYRRQIPFHYAGIFPPTEEAFRRQAQQFAGAVAVVSGLRNARIGQVGVRPATFETVAYDERAMVSKFGQNVIYATLADLVDAAEALADDDPQVVALVAEARQSVAQITVAPEYLLSAAKLERTLADFWERNRLSAMTAQCWPSIQRLLGISVCAVYGRLTGRHLLTACENDVLGALSMLVNHRAALGQRVPHFVDWTIQHRTNPNWLLAWHCGNAPPSLAADAAQSALRSRRDMRGELPIAPDDSMAGLYQFQVAPGPVTFCRLAEYQGQWKMLIAAGRIVPSDETLAGTWSWVQVADHDYLYRTLVEQGFVHHASMIHGDQRAELSLACKFADIEPIIVD
jgi:L-fucose isomerase-like protein